jgi:hypothetical protein
VARTARGSIGLGYASRSVTDGETLAFADDPSRFALVVPAASP